ncbi:MAG: hypothetical protein ACOYNB_11315 [Aquabacterium sp.]|uniref:hypothetical protein n=1 Tax=Aquabacterium sp. TaxID=1872578 RepID=UPI003BBD250E
MTEMNAQRAVSRMLAIVLLIAVSACSTAPKRDAEAEKQAVQEKVGESLSAADKAHKAGQVDQAFEQIDKAIKLDPASKQPWLKRAQIHFDARQYGFAISDAEEVLQRDVNDVTAKSILAVSGLRVSAQALEQLRKVNEVSGSTRSEAESVARIIREALGEPILIPAAAMPVTPATKTKARPAPRKVAGAGSTDAVASEAGPVSTAKPSAPVKPASPPVRNNPFGALQ